jgi:hypothetical protein
VAARSRQRAHFGLGSGGSEGNARHQAMVGASLGPRGGVGRLGLLRKLAEGCAHRGGDNGGSVDGVRVREETGAYIYSRERMERRMLSS